MDKIKIKGGRQLNGEIFTAAPKIGAPAYLRQPADRRNGYVDQHADFIRH